MTRLAAVRRPFGRLALIGLMAVAACAPRLEPAGPAVAPPRLAADRIVAADGATLPLRRWLPEGRPRAAIVGLHGFNDYSHAFENPGTYWATKGIATFAYDQRGFGAAPHPGIWAGHETLAADARAAVSLVRRRYPDTPVYVVGLSMGGAVAMIADAAEPALGADGLVLVAPAVRGRQHLGALARGSLWLFARLLPWFPLTGEGLRIQASDNIAMLRRLGRDPLVLKQTRVDAAKGLVDAMDAALAAAPKLGTRSLIVYGTKDELIPAGSTRDLVARLPPAARHRVAIYPSGWHMLLRDLNAEIVLDDIAAWIADPSAPLPSGAEAKARRWLAGDDAGEDAGGGPSR